MSDEENCVFTAFGKKVLADMAEEAALAEAERVNSDSFPPPAQPTPSDDEDLEEKQEEKEEEKEDEKEDEKERKEEKPEGKKGPKSNAKAKPKAKATMKRPSSNVFKRPASSTKKAKTGDAAAPEEPAEPEETEEPVEEEKKSEKKEEKSEKKEKEKKEKEKKEKEKKEKEKKEKEKKEKEKKEKEKKEKEKKEQDAKTAEYEKMKEEHKKAKAAAKAKAKGGKAKMTAPQRDEERALALKIDSDKEAEEEKEKEKGEEKSEELRDPKKAWYFNKVQAQLPQEIRSLWESKDISRADKSKLVNATVEKKGGHYALVLDNPVISALTETYQSVVGKECLVDFLCHLQIFTSSSILCLLQICLLQISENSSDLICDIFPTCFCIFLFPLFHTMQERCRNPQSFNAGKVGQL